MRRSIFAAAILLAILYQCAARGAEKTNFLFFLVDDRGNLALEDKLHAWQEQLGAKVPRPIAGG